MHRLNRRRALGFMSKAAVGIPLIAGATARVDAVGTRDENSRADPAVIAHWMNEWMSSSRQPVGALHIQRFKDPVYILLKPISWWPVPGQDNVEPVNVPRGFVTDFASIPRLFWIKLRPDGEYTYPAVIHDYLYWTQSTSRKVADRIFRYAMADFGIPSPTVIAIHTAVRLGGWLAWDDNKEGRTLGEKRILKRFP